MNYWLAKSEESCYSICDLKRDKFASWTGVRNYQARNFLRDMLPGDFVFFYHSNSEPTGVAGVARVSGKAVADETQFNKKDEHYDPKATREKPIWLAPEFSFEEEFAAPVSLGEIKIDPQLAGIGVAQRGSRLSVMPVSEKHFKRILALGRRE